MVVSKGWEKGGNQSFCSIGIEFKFYKMKIVLEMDGGDGNTPL